MVTNSSGPLNKSTGQFPDNSDSARDFDRDKNPSYRPHDEAYGDGFDPLTVAAEAAKNKNKVKPEEQGPDGEPYENPLDESQNRDTETEKIRKDREGRDLPNSKKEKAWLRNQEGIAPDEFPAGRAAQDFSDIKATEVNQPVPDRDDRLKH